MKESNRENNPVLDVGRALDGVRTVHSAEHTAEQRAEAEEHARSVGATFAEVERTRAEGESLGREGKGWRKIAAASAYGEFRGRA